MNEMFEILILFIMAFLPPIIYAVWIRNTESDNRERWIPLFVCFLWGATIAVIASAILEIVLGSLVITEDAGLTVIILAVIIAPFAEELTKPLALRLKTVKKELDEPEDGLIYGAVAGLGFSATENLFYGWSFLSEGFLIFLVLIIIRSFSGCLLHASATAWTGYGYGKTILKRTSAVRVLPYFLLAILVHAGYNGSLMFGDIGIITGFSAALIIVILTITIVRKKIKLLDSQIN